jgi:flagellar hook-length control protein FliK
VKEIKKKNPPPPALPTPHPRATTITSHGPRSNPPTHDQLTHPSPRQRRQAGSSRVTLTPQSRSSSFLPAVRTASLPPPRPLKGRRRHRRPAPRSKYPVGKPHQVCYSIPSSLRVSVSERRTARDCAWIRRALETRPSA